MRLYQKWKVYILISECLSGCLQTNSIFGIRRVQFYIHCVLSYNKKIKNDELCFTKTVVFEL